MVVQRLFNMLGIIWDRMTDTIRVKIPELQDTKRLKRRTLLSVTQKIFDPTGITSPSTIISKKEFVNCRELG